jgi:hypothetical protein
MRERISVLLCGLSILPLTLLVHSSGAWAADPAPVTVPLKDWTLLVYLNGDNSLDSFGPTNLKQMETIGSTPNLNLVVQWASIQNGKTERLLVQKSTDPSNVTSPIVQDMGVVDMGDWHSLEAFIEWGAKNYPARHLFVDVWDHGSGWHAIEVQNHGVRGGHIFHPTDISWDDTSGHSITTKQLGQAITTASQAIGQTIDIYGSDACLMGMLEVASEMKGSVGYFVGSQEVEPGAGWPYDTWLARWAANPDMSAKDIATALSEEYAKAYSPGGNEESASATLAVYDMSKQAEIEQAVANLGQSFLKLSADDLKKVATAAVSAKAFTDTDYGDLKDFAKYLGQADVRLPDTALDQLEAAFTDYVVASNVTPDFQGSANGVSIWLPKAQSDYDSNSALYETMAFEVDTAWGNVLKTLMPDISNASSGSRIPHILPMP